MRVLTFLRGVNRRWMFAALALLLVLLLMTIPARIIDSMLPSQFELDGISGTLWHGQAARARLKLPQGDFFLGQMTWQLNPFSLLLLKPTIQLETRWGDQQFLGEMTIRGGESFDMNQVTARLDTALVRRFVPLYIGGSLQADISSLSVADAQLRSMQARVIWQNAAWTANNGDVTLGTYAMDVSTDRGDITADVVTLSGALTVEGKVSLADQHYKIALNLAGPATAHQGLRDALVLMAVPNGQGFDVAFEGALPAK
tara:strand:- start:765 stop:1535 length:771 start_codon:yes stop_codon:yes gene_type:complete